ncbi:PLxRFG domain-containing protein [Acinetobacter sp. TR11]|uniref:PLxRFG domain-containing protein n=1 Tax=Acinetobacter sp. TR11 TaxID=3003393 RepID=UPI0022AC5A95|nr:PLxRFG domain-containing protein [Acinetobacter sp. TR11]WAU72378.1 PLxRFG domain-containing protein [Acinetobacter sp. TR11]
MSEQKKPWEQNWNQPTAINTDSTNKKPWEQNWSEEKTDQPKEKGILGHLKDTGLSALKGAIAVPELAVGVMDMMSDGAVGKTLENKDGAIGFRPKEAKQALGDLHTDQYKAQQQEFADAGKDGNWVDKVVDKTKVALTNPSLIANTVVESVPSMLAGGVLGRASGIANPVVAGAVGEGTVMAGSQAEQIRQETVDGRLTADQSLAGATTGILGGLIGFAGGRLAQKMGIGDVDTMLVTGRAGPAEIAGEIASMPAKSLPRRVVEGAISEGFLEELPQSVSEQILQNLALDKPWHDGIEDAAVMGTLAGMAMGGAANILSGHNTGTEPQDNQQQSGSPNLPSAPSQLGSNPDSALTGEYIPRGNVPQGDNQGRTTFVYDQPSMEADNLLNNNYKGDTGFDTSGNFGPSNNPDSPLSPSGGKYFDDPVNQPQLPSERLGINPNDGPMSSAAALAVDSGSSPIAQLGYTPEQQTQEQSNTPISDAVPSNYQSLLGSQNDGQPFDARFEDAKVQQGNAQADNAGKSISQQYDANAADAMGGGIETDRAKTTTAQTVQPILGQDGKNKWFGTQEKAQAFIDKKDLGNDYQVVQDGKRFEIQPKAKSPVQDDAYFQSQLDQLDKQRAQFESSGDYANAEKVYAEMQTVAREWQTNPSTDTPTTKRAEPSKGASDNAWADFYRKNRNMMSEELFMGGHQDRNTLEEATPEIQSRHAHGMAKATPAAAVRDLKDILENGIDQNRGQGRLFTAPLSQGKLTAEQRSAMSASGTSSGSAYSDGAFTLIAKEGVGDIRSVSEIDAVMVNSAVPQEVVNGLRQDFPNMKFGYAKELPSLLSGGKQSNNAQAQVAELEQQLKNEKSVPKKAQIRKQIAELQNGLTEQAQSTVSLNQPENTTSEHPVNQWKSNMEEALAKADPEHPQFKKLQLNAKHGLKSEGDREAALRQAREIEKKTSKTIEENTTAQSESENPNGKAPSPTEQKIRETLQRNDTQQNGKKMESAATILANRIKKDGPEYFTLGWNKDAQLTAEAHDYVETILDEALSNLGIKGFDDADSFSKLTNDVLESIDDVYAAADDSSFDDRPVKDKDGNYNAPKLVKVKDEKGRTRYVLEHELNDPNVEYLRNFTESGRRSVVKISRDNIFQDTPQNKQDAPKAKAEPEQPKAKVEPSKNTLVSDDRAAELRARLKAKLSQLNSGIDPEIMAIGAELAVYHIERGARKFAAFAKNIANDLDVSVEKIRPYLRSWYNGARDMMEDMGADIQGMDNAETVRAELAKLDNPQQFEAKLYSSLGLELPENQEDTANEQPTSNTSDPQGASAVRGGRGRTSQSDVASGNNRNVDEGVSTRSGTSNQNQSTGRSRIRDTGTDVENDGRVSGRGMESSRREDASGTRQLRVDQPTRLESPAAVANTATDFYMADPELIIGGTQVKRFDKNKAALELLEELTSEGRQATTEEQAILAGYTGWGSFGQDLFQGTWDNPVFKDESVWKERNLWLRERLGKESWESAKDSTINAHFTDPYTVAAMWAMAEKMGFTGGRVLEPAIGTGNFISLMPMHIKQRSQVTGIDLDITTAAIAKQLFPESNVQNMPYQKSQTPDNFYDLVISNVPFADIKIADRRYNQFNPNLHDYYFLKMLDQVRPGGIVMAITSSGTMDKQSEVIRRELAKKAELITSVRLPSGAFQEYAGTAVVTDIIVLRKRAEPLTMTPEVNWIGLSEVKTSSKPVKVNSFYAENLRNVLGTIDYGSGTTRFGAGMIVHRPHDLKQQLEKAANFVPEDALIPRHSKDHLTYYANKAGERTNTLTISNGELMFVYGDQMVKATDLFEYKLKDAKKTAQRQKSIEDLIAIRKAYTDLTDAERIEQDNVEQLRKTLNKLYQAYTKEHGPLADSFGLQYFRKLGDAYYYSLAALEVNGKPAEILKRSVVRGADTLKNPTVSDAFVVERNKTAIPSLTNIAKLANVSEDQARAELIAKGAIYVLPNGDIMPSDMYLSGNVRLKLEEAQNAVAEGNTDLQRNIDALKEIIPEDIPYFNIEAKMGATWVPLSDYEKYIAHMLGMTDTTGITVTFPNGKWKVKLDPIAARRTEAKTNYGTIYKSFQTVVSAALSNQTITVKYKNEDGSESVDVQATEEVNERISKIKEDFAAWLWSDPERRVQLEKEYNHTFNAWATPKYDGSFMSMQGMALSLGNGPFNLRQHQQNAIWRAIVNRRSINAHEVGTGKTFTMGGIAIESRRYGIAKKPLILAHNANSAAVAKEIQMMYPSARVLFISELGKAVRHIRMRQIANDDWDVVVMPHSMIDKLTLSEETLMAMAADDIAALEAELEEALAEEGGATLDEVLAMDSETVNKKMGFKNPTAKQLAKQRLKLLEDIQKQAMDSSKADAVNFEELGVDMIMVDEVHEFKKPSIATRMNMKGLNTSSNKRSVNLQFLTRYVRRMNNGGNVHTFTGTPITNTLTEIYHQMRYVMEEEMQKLNVAAWDGWFGSFATDITDIELSATGEYQLVTRLAGFVNVPELRKMIGQFMDIVFANDMPEMQPRKTKSGKILSDESLTEAEKAELLNGRTEDAKDRPYKKVINVTTEMSPKQEQALAEIQSLAKEWERASGKQKRQWMRDGDPRSPLSISTAAKKASYDARIGDPEYIGQEGKTEDFEMSKASQVVKNVMEVYHSHPLASQVIFADTGYNTTTERSTGQKDANGKTIRERVKVFSPIKDIVERLVQSGIPREQIAIVDGSVKAEARKAIADKMNTGEIRVVIGLTQTLGVGVNMQRNLRAMHHLDAPWMPGELEQRNGRGLRQGNQWNTVLEYRYITDKLDGKSWQVLAIKDRFINSFMKADGNVRSIEGDAAADNGEDNAGDIMSSFSEASGDPRVLQRIQMKEKLEKLQRKERLHTQGIADMKRTIGNTQRRIARFDEQIAEYENNAVLDRIQTLMQSQSENFSVEVDGKKYDKHKEASDAIQQFIVDHVRTGSSRITLGKYGNVTMSVEWDSLQPQATLSMKIGPIEFKGNTLRGIEGKLRGAAQDVKALEDAKVSAQNTINNLSKAVEQPFGQADQLARTQKQLENIEQDLENNPVAPPIWLRRGAPIDSEVYYKGKLFIVSGHRYTNDGWFVSAEDAKGTIEIPYLEATDSVGMQIYEEREFEAPNIEDKTKADNDVKNEINDYSRDKLKPDNERRGTSPLSTSFLPLSKNRADRLVVDILSRISKGDTPNKSKSRISGIVQPKFPFVVVESFEALPKTIQQENYYQGEQGETKRYDVMAVWHKGTLYINAGDVQGNHNTQQTTYEAYEEVILHEVVGHFGVQQLFGQEYKTKFQQLFNALGGIEGIRKIAKDNGVDMNQFDNAYIKPFKKGVEEGRYDPLDAQQATVSELFAFVAQNAKSRPFVRQKLKEVIGYIRQWFRDRGFDKFLSRYNDADLMMFLSEARKAVVDRSYFGKYKNQEFSSKNNSDTPLYSRSTKSNSGSTTQQVRDVLIDRFGKETIDELERQGKLEIIQDYQVEGVEGFYYNAKAVLVASNLTAESTVPTFLHELGGHAGFQNMMNQKQYNELMNQFNKLVEQGNPVALAAKMLAEREQGSERQQLEYLPYLLTLSSTMQQRNVLQRNALQRLIQNIVTYVKAWVFDRFGVNLNLNPDDMLALSERMIEKFSYHSDAAINQHGVAKYSLNENSHAPFQKAIDRVMDGHTPQQFIKMGKTPDVLKMVGMPDASITIHGRTIEKVMGEHLGIEQGNHSHLHNLTPETLRQLPQQINNPIAIFKSADTASKNGYIVLTELHEKDVKTGKEKPIVAALHVKKSNSDIEIINVVSLYGRSDSQLQRALNNDLLYWHKEKGQLFLKTDGLQLPQELQSDADLSDANIKTNEDLVKYQEQPLYSRSASDNDITNRIANGFKNLPKAGDWINKKGVDWLTFGLQALSRRHLTEIYGKLLPPLNKYNELAAQMDADKNDIAAEADNIVREWSKLKDEEALANVMHDATLAQIDPAKPHQSGDNKVKYQQLLHAYNNLSPEAQAMYKRARNAYSGHYAKVREAIRERILRSALSSQKKADLLKNIEGSFGQIKGVYFPLARFGEYIIVMRNKNGDVESVSRAETNNEAESVRSELMKKYPQFKVDKVKLDKEYSASRDGVGRGFMSELFNEVENLGLGAEARAEFEDTLSQLYLSSIPDLSWAKHGIHRKGTAGFSQDARRAFAQHMFSGANYLGKLRYGDQLAQQLTDMQKHADDEFNKDIGYDQRSAQRVISEMEKRHELLMNPKGNPLSSFLTSVGFMYYMGLSPAAAMVNLSQTALIAYPIMGAKWGFDKAGKELLKASQDFGIGLKSGYKTPDFSSLEGFKNSVGDIYNPDIASILKGDELVAYEEAVKRGVIDVTQAHDLAGIAQGEDSKVMWYFRPAMRLASGMFHHAERFNREVTFIAAYRLARQHVNTNGSKATHSEAFDQAIDAVYKGHFDYSTGNRARFMQGNIAKVVLLFKQYAQNMIYTLVRNAHQSIYALDPKEQKEARRALAGILGMTTLAAGAIGLPITGMLFTASILIAKKSKLGSAAFFAAWAVAFFGAADGDDDDPYELEIVIRNWLADIHPKFADLVFGGVPRAFSPVDLSGRVGLSNLIIPDVQEGLEGADWATAMQSALLGPVVGISTSTAKGLQQIQEGDYGRGIETMLPIFLKNAMKSYRYADEGVLTKNKDVIHDKDVTGVELFSQAIGFSPASVRTSYEGRSAIFQYRTKLEDHRRELMRKWVVARQEDDSDGMNKVWTEILEFNEKTAEKNPKMRISRMNLMQSYKATERKAKETGDGGVYLTKRQKGAEEQGGFAFNR